MTALELETALMKRHPKEEYAFFSQVRSGTGFVSKLRTADAIAMSLWPSRGLSVHGFEIKISRGDWTRELKDPAKCDEVAKFCDTWHIVTPKGLVLKGELPPTWGLMEWDGERWKLTAPQRPLKAKPLTRVFVASLLRNFADGMVPTSQVDTLVAASLAKAVAATEERTRSSRSSLQAHHELLVQRVEMFEKASGVSLAKGWQPASDIGRAVKAVLAGEHKIIPGQIKHLRHDVARILEGIDRTLQAHSQRSDGGANATKESPEETRETEEDRPANREGTP